MKFTYVPEEVFGTFFPGADELAEMFGFIQDYGYFGEKIITRGILCFFFFFSLCIILTPFFLFEWIV